MMEEAERKLKEKEEELVRMRTDFDEFVDSSKELEQAMEEELKSKDTELRKLATRLESESKEKKILQEKRNKAEAERLDQITALQKQIDALKCNEESLKGKNARLEIDNEELQARDRRMESEVTVLRTKLDNALEKYVKEQLWSMSVFLTWVAGLHSWNKTTKT